MSDTLLLVGCGKMGGALLDGWLERGLDPATVTIVEPGPQNAALAQRYTGVHVVASADAIAPDFAPAIAVLAVKPQVMGDVLPAYRRFAETGTVFLSIAAGLTSAFFQSALGDNAAIVRAMPNTPAAVRRGITVAFPTAQVGPAVRARCEELLSAVGDVLWTDDENLMDGVTAVSGSGPAYVFLLTECLAQAGIDGGLPEDMARKLAAATVSGAGELMRQSNDTPSTLRVNVTSPGGTTQAALEVLMAADGLQPLMTKAVAAAIARGKELAG